MRRLLNTNVRAPPPEILIPYDWGATQASTFDARQRFSTTDIETLKFSSKTHTKINVSFLAFLITGEGRRERQQVHTHTNEQMKGPTQVQPNLTQDFPKQQLKKVENDK